MGNISRDNTVCFIYKDLRAWGTWVGVVCPNPGLDTLLLDTRTRSFDIHANASDSNRIRSPERFRVPHQRTNSGKFFLLESCEHKKIIIKYNRAVHALTIINILIIVLRRTNDC